MYYEFYIDVFFVVNLVMDFFILQLVNRMILGAANPLRSLAGAVLGAVGSGVILFLPFSSWKIRGLISYGILAPLMVMAGCGTKNKNVFWMELLGFYGCSALAGGIFLAFPKIAARGIITFLALSSVTYWMLVISIRLLKYLNGKRSTLCQIQIRAGKRQIKVKGLYDTGNQLWDSLLKKPVCVIEYQAFTGLLSEPQKKAFDALIMRTQNASDSLTESLICFKPHFICFLSVGTKRGSLLVVTVDEMSVERRERRVSVKKPVLALVKQDMSVDKTFQMIINPEVFDS